MHCSMIQLADRHNLLSPYRTPTCKYHYDKVFVLCIILCIKTLPFSKTRGSSVEVKKSTKTASKFYCSSLCFRRRSQTSQFSAHNRNRPGSSVDVNEGGWVRAVTWVGTLYSLNELRLAFPYN